MNDTYMEYMVKRHRSPIFVWGGYLCVFVAVLSLLMGMLGQPIFLLLFGAFAVAAYFFRTRQLIEFEYLYLEKEISIDKIIGMKKRKKVATFKMENVVIFAPFGSDQAKQAVAHATGSDFDYTSGNKDTLEQCYIIVTGDGNKYILEPSVEFVKMAQMAGPRKVII